MSRGVLDLLIRSRVNTRQLNLLVQLGEKGSVVHAAEAVHMTQPAASKTLATLEENLGITLFTRLARGVEPTPSGMILIQHARRILDQLHIAQEELIAIQTGMTGTINIGASVTPAADIVPRAVVSMKKRFPNTQARLVLGCGETLIQQLFERKLDMAVAHINVSRHQKDLDFFPIRKEAYAIFAGVDHPMRHASNLTLRDLAGQTWVLPTIGSAMRDHLASLFLESGIDISHNVVEASSLSIIIELLRASRMIAPLAISVAQSSCRSNFLNMLPITVDLRLGPIGIILLRDQTLSPAVRFMMQELKYVARQKNGDKDQNMNISMDYADFYTHH